MIALVATLVLGMFGGGAVMADSHSGTGPDDALLPGEWAVAPYGSHTWYAFYYDGKNGAIGVEMFLEPGDGAGFRVVTPAQARLWREKGEITHVGAGSPDEYVKGDLCWTGEFKEKGMYYIVVDHLRNHADPAYYKLIVNGKGVSLPAFEQDQEIRGAAAPVVMESVSFAAPMTMDGSGPDMALTPGTWNTVAKGESLWFAFSYDGKGKPIDITMEADPDDGAIFHVRTPAQADVWRRGGDVENCGCGTADPKSPGDLNWRGEFTSKGTYYIVVESTGVRDAPVSFKIDVSGKGVSF